MTEHGDTTMRWNRSRCVPSAWATAALIGSACDTATTVLPGWAATSRATAFADAHLHLGERLAAGEAEPARVALHGAPLGQLDQRLELGAGPLAEVALEQALVRLHPQAERLGDGRGRLAGALEGRGVDRGDLVALGDAGGDAPRPARGPCRPGAGRRPDPAASCRWWASARGGRAGRWAWAASAWWSGRRAMDRATLPAGPRDPTAWAALRRWRPRSRAPAGRALGWWPGASRWRPRSGRPFRDGDYWGRPVPGFGDPDARRDRRPGARRPRRQPHRPHVHRRPLRATSCTAPCTAPASPTSPRASADDGLRLTGACITAAVRCARRPTSRRHRARDTLPAVPRAGARPARRRG